jgi:hypothetical protein
MCNLFTWPNIKKLNCAKFNQMILSRSSLFIIIYTFLILLNPSALLGDTVEPTATFTVKGTYCTFNFSDKESLLGSAFQTFFNTSPCNSGCGSISVSVNTSTNTICWDWELCGEACRTYKESCPQGYLLQGGQCVQQCDIDTDNDGISDCSDGCPNDPEKSDPGTCGCNVADNDTDGDGTYDCLDECPTDMNKTIPGKCNCGKFDVNGIKVDKSTLAPGDTTKVRAITYPSGQSVNWDVVSYFR